MSDIDNIIQNQYNSTVLNEDVPKFLGRSLFLYNLFEVEQKKIYT